MSESKRKRGKLSREQIIIEATKIIDEIDVEGFSMRSLATAFDVTPMAFYGYFKNKEELLDAVTQSVWQDLDMTPVSGERWDETVRRISMQAQSIQTKHSKTLVLNLSSPSSHNAEGIFALHKNQGMPVDAYKAVWTVLDSFIYGFGCTSAAQQNFDGNLSEEYLAKYDEESFAKSLDIILAGLKATLGPDADKWVTP